MTGVVRGKHAALAGILLAWTLAAALHWPAACTFRDEVGYVGQARLLLAGTFRPEPDSVCYSLRAPRGEVAEYPPFFPMLLAPLFALSPRAVFALGFLSALALAVAAALAVARLGGRPFWGALVLVHPTVLLLSRTVMTDVAVAALSLAAWLSLRSKRSLAILAFFALLVLVKPTGGLIAALLVAGVMIEERSLVAPAAIRAALGAIAGLAGVFLLNFLATGGISYAYSESAQGFAIGTLVTSGGAHVRTLLLAPPLLFLGAVPLWKRRDFGPLFVIAGLTAAMSLYRFVDTGATFLQTLFLAPRLILPVVAFLLAGWGALLDRVAERWGFVRFAVGILLVAAPVAAYGTGALQADLHRFPAEARRVAEREAALRGAAVLGLTPNAFKAGVLSNLPVRAVVPASAPTPVVLCSTERASVRLPGRSNDCDLPGYERLRRVDSFLVLARPGRDQKE